MTTETDVTLQDNLHAIENLNSRIDELRRQEEDLEGERRKLETERLNLRETIAHQIYALDQGLAYQVGKARGMEHPGDSVVTK